MTKMRLNYEKNSLKNDKTLKDQNDLKYVKDFKKRWSRNEDDLENDDNLKIKDTRKN